MQKCKVYIENDLIVGMDMVDNEPQGDNIIDYNLIKGKKYPLAFTRDSDGKIVSAEEVKIVTVEDIDAQVVAKIRERYDENEEYKMLRFGIKDPSNPDFISYDTYVEECREWGQAEKQRLGLIK